MSDPGYFDLQFNGYRGVSFKRPDELTGEVLHRLCNDLYEAGYAGFLPTITTDSIERMVRCLRTLVSLREQDAPLRQMMPGLHIEGPFLNPGDGYRGAHRAEVMQPADPELMAQLLEAGGGLVRLVTLAPERDPGFATTRYLADEGIIVAAGHTDASRDELRGAIDAGLTMFTHLGNGCPMQMHRHDNIVQRALSLRKHLWLCFIADGAHIAWPALDNYLTLAGHHAIVVSDASGLAGLPPGEYTYGNVTRVVGEDGVPRAKDGSHLAGAGITMDQAARNLREHLGLGDARIRQLTHESPMQAIRVTPQTV